MFGGWRCCGCLEECLGYLQEGVEEPVGSCHLMDPWGWDLSLAISCIHFGGWEANPSMRCPCHVIDPWVELWCNPPPSWPTLMDPAPYNSKFQSNGGEMVSVDMPPPSPLFLLFCAGIFGPAASSQAFSQSYGQKPLHHTLLKLARI